MKYLFSLLILFLFVSSCKKEETKKPEQPNDKEVVSEDNNKPVKTAEVKDSVPQATMDIFAAIDAENVEEIRRNIHHNKECLESKDPAKKFHYPLHYAAINGKFESVKILCEYTDVNKRNKPDVGNVALVYASDKGHFEIVKYLIEKGADVNIIFGEIEFGKKVNSGFTALYAACIDDHYKIAKLLIEKGADVNKVCREGYENPETALDIAVANNREKCRLLLTKHGGRKYKDLKK